MTLDKIKEIQGEEKIETKDKIKSLLEKDFVQVSEDEANNNVLGKNILKEGFVAIKIGRKTTYWKPKPYPETFPIVFEGTYLRLEIRENLDVIIEDKVQKTGRLLLVDSDNPDKGKADRKALFDAVDKLKELEK